MGAENLAATGVRTLQPIETIENRYTDYAIPVILIRVTTPKCAFRDRTTIKI
jgi:hypothetical protein